MAVVFTTAAAITAANAGQLVNAAQAGASPESFVGQVAVANGDSIASIFRLARVPSNARMSSLAVFCTAITSAAANVGLYQTEANGGAVVDADFFIAAQTIASASPGLNVIGGNVLSPANREKRIWEALGLAADPQRNYDIALTLTAAATAGGFVGIEGSYVI